MAIGVAKSEAFLAALKQLQSFIRIQSYDNLIDYLLGAFLLFPHLESLSSDYWLAPSRWQSQLYRKDLSTIPASSTLSPSARS